MTRKITIEVSAHDNYGGHIGDQNLKTAIWELENIGGIYLIEIRPKRHD